MQKIKWIVVAVVISFCYMVGHSYRYLTDVNGFLIWSLVLSTIIIFIEMFALYRYYYLRHAKSVKFIFDFIFLKMKIFLKNFLLPHKKRLNYIEFIV